MKVLNFSGETIVAMLMAARNPSLFHDLFRNAVVAIQDSRYLCVPEGQDPPEETISQRMDREAYEELANYFHMLEKLQDQLDSTVDEMNKEVSITGN